MASAADEFDAREMAVLADEYFFELHSGGGGLDVHELPCGPDMIKPDRQVSPSPADVHRSLHIPAGFGIGRAKCHGRHSLSICIAARSRSRGVPKDVLERPGIKK